MTVRTPSYRLYKSSGQLVVTIAGGDYYLGKWNSSEIKTEYDRLIAEWVANGRRRLEADSRPKDLTITEVILAFSVD